MPSFASHISGIPESGVRRIFQLASELERPDDVIMLSLGEPDVAVAPHIAEAAKAAWDRDDTNYNPNGGIPALRHAIVRKLAEQNDVHVDSEQVWITIGGTQALFLAMQLTLADGDEVLIPDPGYTTFTMGARMLNAVPVPYSLRPEHGFRPEVAELEHLVTPRTRAIIVNSPSNPLGAVFPRETLQSLLDFATRHDLWVISDEVYERFAWGEEHVSVASLPGAADADRVLSVFSFSKTYAMTGVRVGWLVTPGGLSTTLRSMQEASISCVATPDQYAALAALEGDQSHVAAALEHYRGNYRAAIAALDELGLRYLEPTGAFYLWIDVSHATDGDVAGWAERFLFRERVAVGPGSAFGRAGEGWIRLCLAANREELLTGISRLPVPVPEADPDGEDG